MDIVDRALIWAGSKYNTAKLSFAMKKVPRYVAAELESWGYSRDWIVGLFEEYGAEDLQSAVYSVSWIYSNIRLIADVASTSKYQVFEKESLAHDIVHELEEKLDSPNPFFGYGALIRYAVWSMMLDDYGGFWYLAPQWGDRNKIEEIWPVPINRLEPIRDENKFISGYAYKRGNGQKPLVIPAKYICRFFFPDPEDLWKNQTPLRATRLPVSIAESISKSQSGLFSAGGGTPLSVVALPQEMNDADFATVRQQIQEDWMNQKRIAVTRAGDLEVKSVGISNRDLEIVASQQLTRDEIDSIFMTFPWRGEGLTSGEAMKQADRLIRERVIYPLHQLMADQIRISLLHPFYGTEYTGNFEDVRQQDRAIQLQERTIHWRSMTLNETRRDLNLPPYENDKFPGLGELPFPWAISPSIITTLYMPKQSTDPAGDILGENVGNIPNQLDPAAEVNLELRDRQRGDRAEITPDIQQLTENMSKGVNPDAVFNEAVKSELQRFRTVVLRRTKRKGIAPQDVPFETDIIPPHVMVQIREALREVEDEEAIKSIFSLHLDGLA